jgi:hypothetical protein
MSGSRLRPYLGPVIALLVVLALGAGTVYAAIPNGDGKYYACYVKNTGAVKLINYPKVKTCQAGEKLINWNAKGPAGPQGAQGAQGPQGPQGPAGPADWNAIPNIPAGFADGVDNDGVTAVKIRTVTSTTPAIVLPGTQGASDSADCPTGFLAVGGGYHLQPEVGIADYQDFIITGSSASDADTWTVSGRKPDSNEGVWITAQVHCLRAEPAGLVIAAKNSNFGPKKAHVRNHK